MLWIAAVPQQKLSWERLPDLGIPRSGHAVFEVDGELAVFGGHTTGFIPTPTAEFFRDGRWQEVPMIYTHDTGYALRLSSGAITLIGGAAEPFGIGQSWSSERYDPAARRFEPMPILDRKRTMPTAYELADGELFIAGNWYAEDGYELDNPLAASVPAGKPTVSRAYPWIVQSAPDQLLVFATKSPWDADLPAVVDRITFSRPTSAPMSGGDISRIDSLFVPLLAQWHPFAPDQMGSQTSKFIGDLDAQDYAWLIPAKSDSGDMAVILMHGGEFSLLELEAPLPKEGPWGPIMPYYNLLADPAKGIAWLTTRDDAGRMYLLRIGYREALAGGRAPLTLFYTDQLPDLNVAPYMCLLSDGRIALAGGIAPDNYKPSGAVYILDPYGTPGAYRQEGFFTNRRLGMLAGILSGLLLIALGWWVMRRRAGSVPDASASPAPALSRGREAELFVRVEALMAEQELFRRKGLTLAEVAVLLGTNTKYLSLCINSAAGCSFTEYVNCLRIRYAQELLSASPGMRIGDVADAAGFTSESAFYRNFKSVTGCTPAEWLSR